ncbi:MAG: FtsW/RodA/SpoVE family cell cycle protein [Xenococcaceae cyanobacterium MO_167.B52]|nr:FtsW/RodA/SpoVE family cell cycle protein [Xenococcaceae cyanobacterium MO_167.B52]
MGKYWRRLRSLIEIHSSSWSWEARLLYWLTGIWLFLGLVTLLSASYPEGVIDHNNGYYTILRQLLGLLIGLIGFKVIVDQPLRQTLKFCPWIILLLLLLIFLISVPGIGTEVYGAKRWIALGPFSLQPSELIKPFLVMQSAYIFAKWRKLTWTVRGTWLGIFALVLLGILIQPDLSTTALCGMSLWLIAVAAELPWVHLLSVCFGGLGLAALSISQNEYQLDRITFFLDPWQEYQGKGYQLIQSLLAIASGGWAGLGLGLSQQKLSYLPIRTTDFIFAVYAEEFGFIGCLLLIILLMLYATIALRVAFKSDNQIQRLVAIGAMVFLVGQSLINIGVATGSLPTTGLPFPFFSYGINSIIASFLLAGLLIRAAREINQAPVIKMVFRNSIPKSYR